MKGLIVYVSDDLFEENPANFKFHVSKCYTSGLPNDLSEYIEYWQRRCRQDSDLRAIYLVQTMFNGVAFEGKLIYSEIKPARKKVIINPEATARKKPMAYKPVHPALNGATSVSFDELFNSAQTGTLGNFTTTAFNTTQS